MFEQRILTVSIDADLKNQNTGQTRHWSTAHREKKLMTHALLDGRILYPGDGNIKYAVFCKEIMLHPFDARVDITVKRILGKAQRLLTQTQFCVAIASNLSMRLLILAY